MLVMPIGKKSCRNVFITLLIDIGLFEAPKNVLCFCNDPTENVCLCNVIDII